MRKNYLNCHNFGCITRSCSSVRVLYGRPSETMKKSTFWPSANTKPLNQWPPNVSHVITSRTSTAKKLGSIRSGFFFLPTYVKYTQTFERFLDFFGSSPRLQARPLDWCWRSIRRTTRFCATKCLFGSENLNLTNLFVSKIRRNYNGANWELKKKNQTVTTSVVSHAHTVVWECCKGDHQSIGKGKIWPSADRKPLNRSLPNLSHVITSRTPTARNKFESIHAGGSSPTYAKYTPSNVRMFSFLPLHAIAM